MMITIQPPEDLLSIALKNVLSYRKDEEFYKLVKDWNKTIVIDVIGFYPVAIFFEGTNIRFDMDIPNKHDLKVTLDADAMMDIAYGRSSPIMSFLKRKIKIKGIFKIGTILRFMKIFLKSMKMLAEEPSNNYYELTDTK